MFGLSTSTIAVALAGAFLLLVTVYVTVAPTVVISPPAVEQTVPQLDPGFWDPKNLPSTPSRKW